MAATDDAPLPRLRPDLNIHPGAPLPDGSPTWIIHDPGKNQFFQIDWMTFEVLSRWELGATSALLAAIQAETTLSIGPSDLEQVLSFLVQNELVMVLEPRATQALVDRVQARQQHWLKSLVHHYLFFRIPLVRPDAFLHYLLPFARPLLTRRFLMLSAGAGLVGLLLVIREWERFTAALVDVFSWEGFISYGVALIGVKILHELGHALQAKRFGCRVPTMGVAFLVMWPVPYTDVNESWKLRDARDRLLISSSGMLTEFCLAAWATLAWVFLGDGPLRNATFVVATLTWVAALAINASPFMRFDGYFVLSDLLGMPNLHARCFALSRWQLRRWVFLVDEALPEELPRGQRLWMTAFGYVTWIYRLTVFLGIAAMVYHYFFKALGLILFGIEIVWFVIMPVWTEIKDWHQRGLRLAQAFERNAFRLIGIGIVLALILPLNWRVQGAGMLRSAQQQFVVLPVAAVVTRLPVPNGTKVAAGAPLVEARSPDIDARFDAQTARQRSSAHLADVAGFSADLRPRQQVYRQEAESAAAQQASWRDEQQRLKPVAAFAGTVVDVLPNVGVGETLGKNTHLMSVIDADHWLVEAYFDEAEVSRIGPGYWAQFIPDTPGYGSIGLTVQNIDRDATRVLADMALAAPSGGSILVREQDGRYIPEQALYRVVFRVDANETRVATKQLRGKVVVWCIPRPYGLDLLRHGLATLIKESGW